LTHSESLQDSSKNIERGILDHSFAYGGIAYVLDGAKHGDIEKSIGMDAPIELFNEQLKGLAHKQFKNVEDAIVELQIPTARLCNQMKISFVIALSMTVIIEGEYKSILLYEGDTPLYHIKADDSMKLLNHDHRKQDFNIRDPEFHRIQVIDRESGDCIIGLTDGADFISEKRKYEIFLSYLKSDGSIDLLEEFRQQILKYNAEDIETSPENPRHISGHEIELFNLFAPHQSDDISIFISRYPCEAASSS